MEIEKIFEYMPDDDIKKFTHKFAEVWGSIIKNFIYSQENTDSVPINVQICT